MMLLNFTCIEKKKALQDKLVSQTIRISGRYKVGDKLHIYWNARNFHVEDVCECGHPKSKHLNDEGMCIMRKPPAKRKYPGDWHCGVEGCKQFKLARQGLGKSKFLGMGEITSIVRKRVRELTEEDAIADGFKSFHYTVTEYRGQNLFTGEFTDPVDCPDKLTAREQVINWLLSHNKGLTLESLVYVIKWRWV